MLWCSPGLTTLLRSIHLGGTNRRAKTPAWTEQRPPPQPAPQRGRFDTREWGYRGRRAVLRAPPCRHLPPLSVKEAQVRVIPQGLPGLVMSRSAVRVRSSAPPFRRVSHDFGGPTVWSGRRIAPSGYPTTRGRRCAEGRTSNRATLHIPHSPLVESHLDRWALADC
jgi:hypothetical protein